MADDVILRLLSANTEVIVAGILGAAIMAAREAGLLVAGGGHAMAAGLTIEGGQVAALTDWLDGWLARRLNQTSAFGAFLDPVADKFLVCASLLVLVHLQRADVFVGLIIIGREIAISALREWMAQIGASRSVAVHMLGKVKTATQMCPFPSCCTTCLCSACWTPTCGAPGCFT